MTDCFLPGHTHCFVRWSVAEDNCSKCGAKRPRILGHGYSGKDDLIAELRAILVEIDEQRYISSELKARIDEVLK